MYPAVQKVLRSPAKVTCQAVVGVVGTCLCLENMPIRDDVKEWTKGAIKAAIREHLDPHGLRKLQQYLPLGTVLGIFVALLALAGAGWNYGFSRLRQEAEFQAHTNDRLETIETDLKNLTATVTEIKFKQLAVTPADSRSIGEAQEMLQAAKSGDIEFSEDAVERVGEHFIQAADRVPEAWTVTKDFLDYRSSLNSGLIIPPPNPVPNNGYHFSIKVAAEPPAEKGPLFTVRLSGTAPLAQSARLDSLSNPAPPGTGSGAKFLIVDATPGAGLSLDDARMRNVLIRNAIIFYSGKPVVLDNVSFMNCTFQIQKNPAGIKIGSALLAQRSVIFKYPVA